MFGVHRRWRMVNRDNDGPISGLAVRLQALQFALQESQLGVSYDREFTALRRNDSRARIQNVAVEPDDRDIRSVQREINSWLGHHGAYEATRLRGRSGSIGTKISEESLQRGNLWSRRRGSKNHAIVIARDSKDGTVVIAERLVELVVIILCFAEVVDHVAQIEEECRASYASRLHIGSHGIRDASFIRDGG